MPTGRRSMQSASRYRVMTPSGPAPVRSRDPRRYSVVVVRRRSARAGSPFVPFDRQISSVHRDEFDVDTARRRRGERPAVSVDNRWRVSRVVPHGASAPITGDMPGQRDRPHSQKDDPSPRPPRCRSGAARPVSGETVRNDPIHRFRAGSRAVLPGHDGAAMTTRVHLTCPVGAIEWVPKETGSRLPRRASSRSRHGRGSSPTGRRRPRTQG